MKQTEEMRHDFFRECCVGEAIFIRQKEMRRKVMYAHIMWVQASGSYCDIFLSTGDRLTVVHTLTDFERKLPRDWFKRVHRSYIVNIHHIEGFIGNTLYIGKKILPVSAPYCKELASCFNILEDSETLFKYKKKRFTFKMQEL